MTNSEIIEALNITAKLMELHNENPFKLKAYANAAFKLKKMRYDFEGKSEKEIENIDGIGKSIGSKIMELIKSGSFHELELLREKTPVGVIEMLDIKGLGPKKVRQLWKDLEIESVGELLYACNENRLISLKGFGEKTHYAVKQSIEFLQSNSDKFLFASLEKSIEKIISELKSNYIDTQVAVVGQMARHCEIIDNVEILCDSKIISETELSEKLSLPIKIIYCEKENFFYELVKNSSSAEHLEKINFNSLSIKHFTTEEEIYKALSLPYVPPELREGRGEIDFLEKNNLNNLVELKDLRGVLHNHSTYSDGLNTLKEMGDYCRENGYDYFGICDHSKSAGYAGGLSIEKVLEQHNEIDELNKNYNGFKILKGIESDILHDGSLDYPEEVLKTFDFVVASVHSGLKMDEEKANSRLIKAIENPYTKILGHPTGRLLLARPGYPLNHKKIIDACAANNVSIELNANPHRLDIDWRWIPYCTERGVKISINPDAHHKSGIHDMHFGVLAARKGLLTKENCLNTMSLEKIMQEFKKK